MFKKIRLLKSGQFSFSPSEKVSVFSEGDVVELPEDRATLLIDVAWAEVFKDATSEEVNKEINKETNKEDSEIDKEEKGSEDISAYATGKLFHKIGKHKGKK